MAQEETRKGPWTEQEDLQLVCFVGLFGDRRWDFIAKVSGLKRTGKSCRLRWVNYLHPGLKRGKMTPQEEKLVLELHSQWGNRWSRIAGRLPGRTDNEIKNYWRTHMRKMAQERKRFMSPSSSNYSSTSSNNEASDSNGITETTTTGSSHGPGSQDTFSAQDKNSEQEAYSMDDIWKDITSSEDPIKPMCEVRSNFSSPPIASALWEYCPDPIWKMDDEETKMSSTINDPFLPHYGP